MQVIATDGSLAASGAAGMRSITAEDFLALLIAQLQLQDPFDPMTNEQMLSQVATIEQMQSSLSLTATLNQLGSQQEFGAASSLIGKYVQGAAVNEVGQSEVVAGKVVAVHFVSNGQIVLGLDNGKMLPMESVVAIGAGQNDEAVVAEEEQADQGGAVSSGDVNEDGVVDELDLVAMAAAYSGPGQTSDEPRGDLDGDGDVDGRDFGILLEQMSVASTGDLNQDGVVDETDLAAMVEAYTGGAGGDELAADLDGDGDVDEDDFGILLDHLSADA